MFGGLHEDRYRLGVMLLNLHNVYSLMEPAVEQGRNSRRRIVEKKVREMTKIAKWDEQTYYSLQQTSERSHRLLFRHVVEWRQILEEKCGPVFENVSNVRSFYHYLHFFFLIFIA